MIRLRGRCKIENKMIIIFRFRVEILRILFKVYFVIKK